MAAEDFEILRTRKRETRQRNLEAADPTGWTLHTPYHWSRQLGQYTLHYWPSSRKFMYRDEVMQGDVKAFIVKMENS